jgi:hypothetical protein
MTPGGTYLCSVCHKAFVTMGRKNGHVHEEHAEAAQIYYKLEEGTRVLYLPGVQASVPPSRIYHEAPAGV